MMYSRKTFLLATTAAVALMLAAPAALAQTAVDQSATNNATVTNTGMPGISVGAGNPGAGASAAIGATGAVSAVSVIGINQNLIGPVGGFADIKQVTTNAPLAGVTNSGAVTLGPGNTTSGDSFSVSATGAASSVSILGINSASTAVPVGNVDQKTISNGALIQNTGTVNGSSLNIAGEAPSLAVSATGAVAAVSVTGFGTFNDPSFGTIDQGTAATPVTNSGDVTNKAGSISTGFYFGTAGASISASATGAVSSVSTLYIDGGGAGGIFGKITQNTDNTGTITNTATSITSPAGGFQNGAGTSVSASATGAVSSVSRTAIANAFAGGAMAAISQTTTNSGAGVSNSAPAISMLENLGTGSSVSDSATGSASSVSLSINGSGNWLGMTFAGVTQKSDNSAASVLNQASTITTGDLGFMTVGAGASVSSSATGAAASIGLTVLESTPVGAATVTFAAIDQTATNATAGGVTDVNTTLNVGVLKGNGSSASVSATGAIASISATSINSSEFPLVTGTIKQTATNGNVTTISPINNTGAINQTGAGGLSGIGSSVGISATGAAASVSVASINDGAVASPTLGATTQSATNFAGSTIANTGTITLAGPISGNGASASISATGAGAFVSFRSVH